MKSDYNKDFDKQIKKKFDEFSPEVPSSLWDEIEKEIRTETSINPKPINHKLLHSASADLDMISRQINDSTVISDPKVKNIDQEIKVRSIDGEIRNIDRSFKFKRFIGIAASLLIIGFSIWKFQPEEKVFLRGPESLVKKADSDLTGINSENVVTEIESEHSRTITNSQLVDGARIAKSSKVKISGTENRKGLPFEESTFVETSEFSKPASGKIEARLRDIASISSSKSTTLFKSESKNGNNKVSSSALPHKSRLESKDLESLDNQELTLQNQELALNTPSKGSVYNSNLGNQNANVLNTPDIVKGNRLSSAEPNASIPNEEQNLLETEPKEKQKIVSSVLNFLASNLQIGGDKVVEFSETENGIIKVDLKGIFARNNH